MQQAASNKNKSQDTDSTKVAGQTACAEAEHPGISLEPEAAPFRKWTLEGRAVLAYSQYLESLCSSTTPSCKTAGWVLHPYVHFLPPATTNGTPTEASQFRTANGERAGACHLCNKGHNDIPQCLQLQRQIRQRQAWHLLREIPSQERSMAEAPCVRKLAAVQASARHLFGW